jgi:hypothetical protein
MNLFLNEDGSMPGEPLPFLEAFIWFFVAPVGIFLAVWLFVVASENLKKARAKKYKEEVLTYISE